MGQIIDADQGSRMKQIILRCYRFAPAILAVLYVLVVFLSLFGAGKLSSSVHDCCWSCSSPCTWRFSCSPSGRIEAWCAVKEWAASAADYCRRNYTRVIYYVVILLYGTALLFADGVKDAVTLLAPALVAVAKVVEDALGNRGGGAEE